LTGLQQALRNDDVLRQLPVYYFMPWDCDGTPERLHHVLCFATREREGREASPTAAIINSQSVKSAQKGVHA
jgi:hypothetical protein